MKAKLIDGKKIAREITERAKRECADLGFKPGLGVVLVGDDPASHLYVSLKEKACREVGIAFERVFLAPDAPIALVLRAIENFNRRTEIDAILVQLPLPPHLDAGTVVAAMDPEKDVDGFHPDNVARLRNGAPTIVPGLAAGILALAKASGEPLAGKRALVVANSPEFYAPLEVTLRSAGLEPSYAKPDDAGGRTREADLVIVAVGIPGWLTGVMVKPGAIVIDVGTNKVDGKTVGDADASVLEVAGHVTPVPGGVGPVTVAMLVKNAVALAKRRRL
ncbi:MAG TPA: bifunctional 5,10-methylenetetrahydrofolate dehydrogenase/5,10-methenyltetrahydrofolate cyclohydrolase [Candidatus Binatia bacterium]|jgi:methylenetetrahydrofolate dehydrogenase (NADP+)/methenyltetrahydrofolate cyclohydrolase|nr:bifunctional 5,10-methylenetetrahydrofolate dehydrogenase/5,10-methenyltetrahydrofolate cyclohydrolase [Candidatus Binatia bacterium]